jgi:hypothetical protein
MVGIGIENTYANFRYIFEYEIPDTMGGIPYGYTTVQQPVSVSLKSQSRYRTTVGCSLRMGFIFIHYDYNITPYATHNGLLGLTIR